MERQRITELEARHYDRTMGKKNIIVVDDNVSFLSFLRAALSGPDSRVEAFQSPFEAIRRFSEVRPEVVILDINMPEMDGFTLFKILGEMNTFNAKIFFLTANDCHDRDLLCDERLKGIKLLKKPISPTELKDAVLGDK